MNKKLFSFLALSGAACALVLISSALSLRQSLKRQEKQKIGSQQELLKSVSEMQTHQISQMLARLEERLSIIALAALQDEKSPTGDFNTEIFQSQKDFLVAGVFTWQNKKGTQVNPPEWKLKWNLPTAEAENTINLLQEKILPPFQRLQPIEISPGKLGWLITLPLFAQNHTWVSGITENLKVVSLPKQISMALGSTEGDRWKIALNDPPQPQNLDATTGHPSEVPNYPLKVWLGIEDQTPTGGSIAKSRFQNDIDAAIKISKETLNQPGIKKLLAFCLALIFFTQFWPFRKPRTQKALKRRPPEFNKARDFTRVVVPYTLPDSLRAQTEPAPIKDTPPSVH